MWQRLGDAIRAPPGAKPSRDHFSDGSLLELRMDSLESYALGEGCYSSGQKAAAADTLTRAKMRGTERSAFDLLVAIGRWSGFENLALRRYDVPINFGSKLLAQATELLASPPADEDASTRKNLTRLTVYAIDSDDTVEIDDGVSAEFLGDGRIRVWIHVAVGLARFTTLFYSQNTVQLMTAGMVHVTTNLNPGVSATLRGGRHASRAVRHGAGEGGAAAGGIGLHSHWGCLYVSLGPCGARHEPRAGRGALRRVPHRGVEPGRARG